MKKINRVLKYREFHDILNSINFIKGTTFAIYFRRNEFGYERYGLLVTKKNGHAVIRNKIKRQVRSIIDKISDYSLPLDVIVVVKRNYDVNSFEENDKELVDILSRVRSQNE